MRYGPYPWHAQFRIFRTALSGCGAAERAVGHLALDTLHRTTANTTLSGNPQHALAGLQLALDSLFKFGTALLRPALMRWRIMLLSNSANAPVI